MKAKTLNLTLPLTTLEVVYQLLQQMVQLPGAIWLGEQNFLSFENEEKIPSERFAAVLSARFNVLVRVNKNNLATNQPQKIANKPDILWNVQLTFEPEAIAIFLSPLVDKLSQTTPNASLILDPIALKQRLKNINQNAPEIQSEFTFDLLEIIANSYYNQNNYFYLNSDILESNFSQKLVKEETIKIDKVEDLIVSQVSIHNSCVTFCQQPVEVALQQQLAQERLLNQVTTQIRQSLELPEILSKAVERVREFLEVDRLIIYQFEKIPKLEELYLNKYNSTKVDISKKSRSSHKKGNYLGRVTYESLANNTISSVLNLAEDTNCLKAGVIDKEKYRKGLTFGVTDVEKTYASQPCFLNLMRQVKVRAKLLVPIVVQEELWGLLIAHHSTCRDWEESKKIFLQQIAEHLAIAIYQAELYAQVQQQKRTLEQRVIERTTELRDALAAAQSASLAKSEFLAAMSHELRTPLTCVIGISDTLLRWSYGKVGSKEVPIAKQRKYLETIRDSGEHLLELINDILDLSQVEAGKAVLKISEFSLSKLASQTLHALKEKAVAKGVELVQQQRINQEYDLFTADPRRLRQILFNLLGNAIKFTPAGGRIILRIWVTEDNKRTPIVQVPDNNHTISPGKVAVFQIKDTGIGIPEDQRSLLFQKFQQLDSPYRREYGGTGLGLALTKQLVELHGGAIEVESKVDVGSTFTVFIPLQHIGKEEYSKLEDEKLNSSLPLHSSSLRGTMVLIEEDEETAMEICDILTAAGLQVVWMIEGSGAVEQIELLQPNAVIIDMRLPGMNGGEIIQKLRKKAVTKNMNILALTTQEIPDAELYLVTSGANDCLVKPIKPQQLLEKVIRLMANGNGV